MVVGDDYIKPLLLCLLNLNKAGYAAINGDDESDTILVHIFKHGGGKSMPLGLAVRYVRRNIST